MQRPPERRPLHTRVRPQSSARWRSALGPGCIRLRCDRRQRMHFGLTQVAHCNARSVGLEIGRQKIWKAGNFENSSLGETGLRRARAASTGWRHPLLSNVWLYWDVAAAERPSTSEKSTDHRAMCSSTSTKCNPPMAPKPSTGGTRLFIPHVSPLI